MPDALPPTPIPSPPPRPVTPAVRWRAWADPQARLWWGSALVLVLGGLYLCGARLYDWRQEVWLIRNGKTVVATVVHANNETIPRKQPGDALVILNFDFDGQHRAVAGHLEGRKVSDEISVKDQVPIRIDPKNPEVWTARTVPGPLGTELIGGAIAIGLGIVAVLPAIWVRRRVLQAWRHGEAAEAVVRGRQQTPLAPRSRILRCSLADGVDNRVFSVYVPSRAIAQTSETLWVLMPRGGGRFVAAAWFE